MNKIGVQRAVVTLSFGMLLGVSYGSFVRAEEVEVFEMPLGAKTEDPSAWQAVAAAGALKAGCAIRNAKVTVVAMPGSGGLVIRSVKADAPASATVRVLSRGVAGKIETVELLKKEKAEATLRLVLGGAQAEVTLKSGQPFLAVTPVKDADAVEVCGKTAYAVLPDFFGYDTIYDPRRFKSQSLMVPAENFLLGMEEGGDAMILCVWQGTLKLEQKEEPPKDGRDAEDQRVDFFLGGEGPARKIERMRIEMLQRPVYVALLANKGLWFDQDVGAWEAQKPMDLDWKRPFEAKWRAAFLGKEGLWSKDLLSANFSGDVVYQEKPDAPILYNPGLLNFILPLWIVKDRVCLALYADRADRAEAEKKNREERAAAKKEGRPANTFYPRNLYERAVLYPLDRVTETPLAEYTVVDVVRETLGQGPCEYVLDLEGVKPQPSGGKGNRDTLSWTCGLWDMHLRHFDAAAKGKDPTGDYKVQLQIHRDVAALKNFKGYCVGDKKLEALKPGEKFAPELEARLIQALEDMGLFVGAVNARINEYRQFTDKLVAFCKAEGQRTSQIKPLADKLLEKAGQLQVQTGKVLPGMNKSRDEWVAKMALLVAEAKAGNYANIASCGAIRNYAEGQDNYVAFCRRFVKAIRAEASAVDSSDPEVIRFAARVRAISHDALRNKISPEGM